MPARRGLWEVEGERTRSARIGFRSSACTEQQYPEIHPLVEKPVGMRSLMEEAVGVPLASRPAVRSWFGSLLHHLKHDEEGSPKHGRSMKDANNSEIGKGQMACQD